MARPPGDSARDRLNLFLAIVPFVLTRGVTNVTEIAERFNVSTDRVTDAIIAIACDGGAGEARLNFDTELFNIDWDAWEEDQTVILTVAEALRPGRRVVVLGLRRDAVVDPDARRSRA